MNINNTIRFSTSLLLLDSTTQNKGTFHFVLIIDFLQLFVFKDLIVGIFSGLLFAGVNLEIISLCGLLLAIRSTHWFVDFFNAFLFAFEYIELFFTDIGYFFIPRDVFMDLIEILNFFILFSFQPFKILFRIVLLELSVKDF
jgi:hypothetical protein